MERLNSGESKTIVRNISCIGHHWSDDKWKRSMARGGGNKKSYQYCTVSSGTILFLLALQGHSGRSLIDPTLQDNVIIPSGFFQYIYHVGFAINLHSIVQFGIDTGRSKFEQLTDSIYSFCLWIPWTKNQKDPDTIDLNEPRHARYMHKVYKKNQNTVFWVDITFCSKERIEVLSDAIERYHSLRYTPSLLYPESCWDGNWRSHIRESIHVNSTSSKDLLER